MKITNHGTLLKLIFLLIAVSAIILCHPNLSSITGSNSYYTEFVTGVASTPSRPFVSNDEKKNSKDQYLIISLNTFADKTRALSKSSFFLNNPFKHISNDKRHVLSGVFFLQTRDPLIKLRSGSFLSHLFTKIES